MSVSGFPQALEIMETGKITKKSSMHEKIMEFEKNLNNHGKIMEFCEKLVVSSFNYLKMHAWYTSMLLLLHSTFMLSVVKMLLKGEVGGSALNSHGNYIVAHGKSWKLFEFLTEPCSMMHAKYFDVIYYIRLQF